jgi:SAM-dependent methyltransferase
MGSSVTSSHLRLHRNILRELGHELDPAARVLDFGCGSGRMVVEYRQAGFEAFGCDLKLEEENALLRRIEGNDYRLPYEDDFFDFVFSDQVLEHVQNHRSALAEIWRVLKPGGISLHIFPSKLKPTEAHVFVPFAGALQSYPWLLLWAFLGLRNSFQAGKSYREVADFNYAYLRDKTRYLTKAEITEAVSSCFGEPSFVEKYLIKHSYGRARYVYPLTHLFPFIVNLYRTFYSRAIFFQKIV